MPNHPIIYTVRMDVTDEVRSLFEEWASTRHIEDPLAAGVLAFLAGDEREEYVPLVPIGEAPGER